MDSVAFIGLALIVLVILPVFIFNQIRRNKEKAQLNELTQIAKNNGCRITEYDICNQCAIALDAKVGNLFFIRNFPTGNIDKEFNMASIKKCYIVNSAHSAKMNNSDYSIVDKVSLVIESKEGNKTYLDFFISQDDSQSIADEMHLANKWEKRINEMLKRTK